MELGLDIRARIIFVSPIVTYSIDVNEKFVVGTQAGKQQFVFIKIFIHLSISYVHSSIALTVAVFKIK